MLSCNQSLMDTNNLQWLVRFAVVKELHLGTILNTQVGRKCMGGVHFLVKKATPRTFFPRQSATGSFWTPYVGGSGECSWVPDVMWRGQDKEVGLLLK